MAIAVVNAVGSKGGVKGSIPTPTQSKRLDRMVYIENHIIHSKPQK